MYVHIQYDIICVYIYIYICTHNMIFYICKQNVSCYNPTAHWSTDGLPQLCVTGRG